MGRKIEIQLLLDRWQQTYDFLFTVCDYLRVIEGFDTTDLKDAKALLDEVK